MDSVDFWIRSDGSRQTGMGHIMRMVAVAEESSARGCVTRFVTRPDDLAWRVLQRALPHVEMVESRGDDWLGRVKRSDAVLFDGYDFEPDVMKAAGDIASCVAAVDDFGNVDRPVDVLINPSTPDGSGYRRRYERMLLGPMFAPVRKEFLRYRRPRGGGRDHLLVTLGSSDVASMSSAVLSTLGSGSPFVRTTFLVGPGMSIPVARGLDGVAVVQDPPDVAALFDRADAVIAAAGVTTWELMTMGVPTALLVVADNQVRVMQTATQIGAALPIRSDGEVTASITEAVARLAKPSEQRRLSSSALELTDGLGAARIVDSLVELATDGGRHTA